MAAHVFNELLSVVQSRQGVYHLRIERTGTPGPDGVPVTVTCTLRGHLAESTPQGLIDLVKAQKSKRGVYCKEGPVQLESGTIVESTYYMSPDDLAKAL